MILCPFDKVSSDYILITSFLSHRGRVSVTDSTSDGSDQPASRVKLTVTVYKDLVLHHYGFEICPNLPLTIASVTAGKHCFLLPTITGVRSLNCPRWP